MKAGPDSRVVSVDQKASPRAQRVDGRPFRLQVVGRITVLRQEYADDLLEPGSRRLCGNRRAARKRRQTERPEGIEGRLPVPGEDMAQ